MFELARDQVKGFNCNAYTDFETLIATFCIVRFSRKLFIKYNSDPKNMTLELVKTKTDRRKHEAKTWK